MPIILLILLLISTNVQAAAPTRAYTYVSNTTIDPNQNNTNENLIFSYLQTGVDTYAAGSITGAAISASASIPYASLSLSSSIQPSDIASGSLLMPSGAVFFMITGSCPTGSTDVSATYSNKFIKINATAGTSGGVVLTGTTDSHVITTGELPASALTFTRYDGNGSALTGVQGTTNGANAVAQSTSNMGSGGGHTHTLSTATTLEPVSITLKMCQVS